MKAKYFQKYSNDYKKHLLAMQENEKFSEKDKEAIEIALYWIAQKTELAFLLSEQLKLKTLETVVIPLSETCGSDYCGECIDNELH